MYNIQDNTGRIMLGVWVLTNHEALKALQHYITKYPPGGLYPNGKGRYPDWGFHIVWRENEENCDLY